jgi:isopenicillin N synthase-like dioxygenase
MDGQLAAPGLGLEVCALQELTKGGWHHMRALRYPAKAHTDYGLLVTRPGWCWRVVRFGHQSSAIAVRAIGGESMAGTFGADDGWTAICPRAGVLTALVGDIMQPLTNGYFLSTRQASLDGGERYYFAYFHEPGFDVTLKPLVRDAG